MLEQTNHGLPDAAVSPCQAAEQRKFALKKFPSLYQRNSEQEEQETYENPQSEKIHKLFEIPDFKSKPYETSIQEIIDSLKGMDDFTDRLEQKVDNLLLSQEREFADSYRMHMHKIQESFKGLQWQVKKQKETIKYYESKSQIAMLVQKITSLEQESKKLYGALGKKGEEVKSLKMQIQVQKDQNRRMVNQIKFIVKNKSENEANTNQETGERRQSKEEKSPRFFTTDIQAERSLKRQLSCTTDEKNHAVGFTCNVSDRSINEAYSTSKRLGEESLNKKIHHLTLKNKKLASLSSKVLGNRNQLQTMFMDAVTEIKKNIRMRRKIKQCTYQDFKKEDKLTLLVAIISNQQILKAVYDRLFGSKSGIQKYYSAQKTIPIDGDYRAQKSTMRKTKKRANDERKSQTALLPYLIK